MDDSRTTVCVSIDIALAPVVACDVLSEELATALARGGMSFEACTNGRVVQGELEVGRVVSWKPGERVVLQWHQADWKTEELTEVEVRLEPVDGGTRATLEHRGWGGLISDPRALPGWVASEVAAPPLQATAPAGLGNCLTDHSARRPSAAEPRAVY